MGYRIDYEGGKMHMVQRKERSYAPYLICASFLVFLLLVHFFWPEGAVVLKTVLIPSLCRTEKEAVAVFLEDMQQGCTVTESLQAFCQTILKNARIP